MATATPPLGPSRRAGLSLPKLPFPALSMGSVVLAALRNAATVTGRTLADLRVVVAGAGAAGIACTKILLEAGVGDTSVAERSPTSWATS